MHAEDSIVDDSAHWEHIETDSKLLPDLDVVAALALIIEAVHPIDRLALVIASQQEEVVWELDLERQHQANSLNALFPTIDVISDEKVLLVAVRVPSNVEESEQIEVLSVYISEDLYWCLDLQEHFLVDEDSGRLIDQELDGLGVELDWLSPLAILNFHESSDNLVDNELPLSLSGGDDKIFIFLELILDLVELF